MKGKSLERMDTDELMQELSRIAQEIKHRLADEEKQLKAKRHTLAKTVGHLGILESSNDHTAPRQKRKVKVHPQLSKLTQQIRHAENKRPKPKDVIEKLKAEADAYRAKHGMELKYSKAA